MRQKIRSGQDTIEGDANELIAREGDVIVVSYPEVTIPLPTKYATVKCGGLIYTRRLVDGDNVQIEHERIYAFLKRTAERDAREKVRVWSEELAVKKVQREVPPKPTAAGVR